MNTGRGIRSAALVLAAALCPAAARAQFVAGGDVDWNGAYVWRGLVRSAGQVLQPGGFAGLAKGQWRLAAGAWTNLQLGAGDADDWNDAGAGGHGRSETDWWVEYSIALDPGDLRLGWVYYDYGGGGGPADRRTDANDTYEVYAGLRARRVASLPVQLGATLWYDPKVAKGAYLEGVGTLTLPLVPMFANLDIVGTVGLPLGQERDPGDPGETFVAAGRGISFVDLAPAIGARLGAFTPRLALHYQWNIDTEIQRVRTTDTSHHLWWVGVGVGVALGGRP